MSRGGCGQEAFPPPGLLMKAGEELPGSTRLSLPHFPSPVPSHPPRVTLLPRPHGAACYHSGLSSNATASERASPTTCVREPPRLAAHGSLSRAQTTVWKMLERDSVDDLAVMMMALWWLSLKVSLSFRVTDVSFSFRGTDVRSGICFQIKWGKRIEMMQKWTCAVHG